MLVFVLFLLAELITSFLCNTQVTGTIYLEEDEKLCNTRCCLFQVLRVVPMISLNHIY